MNELEQVIDPIVNSVLEKLKSNKFSSKTQLNNFIDREINQNLKTMKYNIYRLAEEMAENEDLYEINWNKLPSNIEGCVKTIVESGIKKKIKNRVLYFKKGEIQQ